MPCTVMGDRMTAAALELGISRAALYQLMEKLQISSE